MIVGAVLGILVAVSSVGAGAIGVIALIILYPQLQMARIIGSDIVHAVPLTLLAGVGHWMIGTIGGQCLPRDERVVGRALSCVPDRSHQTVLLSDVGTVVGRA